MVVRFENRPYKKLRKIHKKYSTVNLENLLHQAVLGLRVFCFYKMTEVATIIIDKKSAT